MPLIEALLMSPFLPGLIFVVAAIITKRFPPAHINPVYGYRTTKSMRSDQNWKTANAYSTQLLLISGIILMVAGATVALLVNNTLLLSILTPVSVIIAVLVIFLRTEKRLQ
ncbi:SdpI family protein [Chitinophaga rhizophila]|uniref:SdpI family protein n=1 Tax=Chitinophaga rhizophila TaxID=2866212 RepID=A0ABS7GG52_9BACT|nr:SdpI family protein [Chitinophaga rhizophila]MBW8686391.1 SdpI family protein [Chitinophaga rhizophila]